MKDLSESELTSVDDETREELLWNKKIEILLTTWKNESTEREKLHEKAAKISKALYYTCSLPCIVIPFCTALITSAPNVQNSKFVQDIILFLLSCLNAINTFFNFGQKFAKHEESASKYADLVDEIETVLVKPKKNRIAADVQIEIFKNRLSFLNKTCISI